MLAKLKDFTEMMTGGDEKVEATGVGGMSPDVPHARSDGLMGPKQLSRFEKMRSCIHLLHMPYGKTPHWWQLLN